MHAEGMPSLDELGMEFNIAREALHIIYVVSFLLIGLGYD